MTVLEIVVALASGLLAAAHGVHILQLGRYQLPVYREWMRRSSEVNLRKYVLVGVMFALLRGYLPMLLSLFITVETARTAAAAWLIIASFLAVTVVASVRDLRLPLKKPLVLTPRALRLMAVIAALALLGILLFRALYIAPYLIYALIPWLVWFAGRILEPFEEKINAGFYAEAKAKLAARDDLVRIGITGSYGKTLTKFILAELLSARYQVLATPASFNTPMGISRVINEQLRPEHQVFIAEMGAQHIGDIRHLTALVQPKFGAISAVGAQHLETFGSIANIAQTKYELIEGLPEDGAAFFALDGGYVDRLFAQCNLEKYGASAGEEAEAYMRVVDVDTGAQGMEFTLCCADGERVRCRTQLLGRYNALNIALAASIARKLGLSMKEIAEGVERLKPFERKLQLIRAERTVIDDTLNDRPEAAEEALKVLGEFPGRRIVTAGIPCDEEAFEEVNYAFGAQMKDRVDQVVLVGEKRRVRPILRGLSTTGLPRANVYVVSDTDDAEDLLDEISDSGDSVLYECELS